MLTYTLEKSGDTSLYEQLYRHIKGDILSGELTAGEKLPSKRALAAHLRLSVITVKNAYEQLVAEGDIVSNPGSSQGPTTQAPGTTEKDPIGDIDFSRLSQEEKVQVLTDSLSTAGVNDVFIKAYPLGEDTDFWSDLIFDTPLQERAGNRKMRALLIERVLERDGRFTNTLLGISHTRSSSLVWPERDIETQLDSLGILGFLLFVGPYFAVLAFSIWKFFKGVKNHLKISYCVYFLSAGLGVVASYFSGHIMNEFFPFVYLALMMGMAVNTAFEKGVETEE